MRRKASFWTKEQKSIEEFFPTLLKTCFVCSNRAKFEIEDIYGKFTLCERHFEDILDISLPPSGQVVGQFAEDGADEIFSILAKLSPLQIKKLKEKMRGRPKRVS